MVDPRLCSFGETGEGWPGPHHCARCAAYVEEAVTWMAVAYALGTHDREGYTPNERKAQQKRRKITGGVDPDTGASRSAPVPEPTNPIVEPGQPPQPTHPIVEPPQPGVPPGGGGERPDRGRPGRPGDRPDVEPPDPEVPTEPEPKR